MSTKHGFAWKQSIGVVLDFYELAWPWPPSWLRSEWMIHLHLPEVHLIIRGRLDARGWSSNSS